MHSGAPPDLAFADLVKDGPRNVVYEMEEALRKEKSRPSHLVTSFGTQTQRWRLSSTGNLIIPVINDAVGGVMQAQYRPKDQQNKRRGNDTLAKAGDHVGKLQRLGTEITKGIAVPASITPLVVQALDPTTVWLKMAPVLISLGVLAYFRMMKK